MGLFFAPLLSVVGVVVLLAVFFAKYHTLMAVGQPPDMRFRARSGDNFSYELLLVSLFLAAWPVGYTLVRIAPSSNCSPFRGLDAMWDVVPNTIRGWPAVPETAAFFIGTEAFAIPLFLLLW